MDDSETDALGQGIEYQGFLPLKWRAADDKSVADQALRLDESNEEIFRYIGILDEYIVESGDEREPLTQELSRVEAKVNLLLGLVGQLMTSHFPLPPVQSVTMNTFGVEWIAKSGPRPGSTGIVEIYIDNRCPRPLMFAGQILEKESCDGGYRFKVQFAEMSESVQDRLEKMIFRHHRRSVALARRRGQPSPEQGA